MRLPISHELGRMLITRDVLGIRAVLIEMYHLNLDEEPIKQLIKDARGVSFDSDWGGWIIWLKAKIQHLIPFGANNKLDSEHVIGYFNFFFLQIEETPEMLIRLRGLRVETLETTARSRITNYQSSLTPVNQTAANISPIQFLQRMANAK